MGLAQRTFYRILADSLELGRTAAADDHPLVLSLLDDSDEVLAVCRVSLAQLFLGAHQAQGAALDLLCPLLATGPQSTSKTVASVGVSVSLYAEDRLLRHVVRAPSHGAAAAHNTTVSSAATQTTSLDHTVMLDESQARPTVVATEAGRAPSVLEPLAHVVAAAADGPPSPSKEAHAGPDKTAARSAAAGVSDEGEDEWTDLAGGAAPSGDHLHRFEESSEYQAALEIALWKERERERFEERLKEREREFMAELERAAAQREAVRVAALDKREEELKALEVTLRQNELEANARLQLALQRTTEVKQQLERKQAMVNDIAAQLLRQLGRATDIVC